jgi:hypothetical protein
VDQKDRVLKAEVMEAQVCRPREEEKGKELTELLVLVQLRAAGKHKGALPSSASPKWKKVVVTHSGEFQVQLFSSMSMANTNLIPSLSGAKTVG